MNDMMSTLSQLRDRQILRFIDVELCRFLRDRHPKIADNVLFTAALTSHLYRQGHVCLVLDEYAGRSVFEETEADPVKAPELDLWRRQLQNCPAVGQPGDYKPLILDDSDRLYMHKLWHYEHTLAEELIKRGKQQVQNIDKKLLQEGLARLFSDSSESPDWQQVAAATSVRKKLSIISGGPGTGKTSTVVRILALILEQHQQNKDSLTIALAAPTGKAAARLKDAIINAKEHLDVSENIRKAIPEKAKTLHQLLGARRYSSQFKHDVDNPIPYDLVVVDEASMVDQALMSKLVDALLNDAQLILLGDKDQLASVEAGSVLGDICDVEQNTFSQKHAHWLGELSLSVPDEMIMDEPTPLTDNITLLTKSYRFAADSGIAWLSRCVNEGDADEAVQLISSSKYEDISLIEIQKLSEIEDFIASKIPGYFQKIVGAQSPKEALRIFNQFRMLSPHRHGPWGIRYLNQSVERLLSEQGLIPKYKQWYPGKPVIINTNDYSLELFNGDTGLCFPDDEGTLKIYFQDEGEIRAVDPKRLPSHNTAYALTVHKSQGSEFDEVLLVLPRTASKVVSRELIYTAITRARTKISIAGTTSVLGQGIKKKIRRSSGLRDYLWSK